MTDSPQEPNSGSETSETLAETEARLAAANTANNTTEQFATPPAAEPAAPAAEPAASDQTWAAAPAGADTTTAEPKKSNGKVGLVAALVVGALVGGVSGAGVTVWAMSANQNGNTASAPITPQNVTVNDTENVNVVTAVAAKAAPSVVTISTTSTQEAGTGSGIVLSKDGYVLTNTHVVTLDGEISDPTLQVTTEDGHIYEATVVGTDPTVDLAVIKLKGATDLTPAEFGDSSKLNVGQTAVAIGAPLGLSNTVTDGIVSALNRSISIASSAAPDASSGDSTTPDQNGQNGPFDFWNFDLGQGQGQDGQQQQQQQQQSAAPSMISLPVIQTDAAINPGNSGGALLNANAQVIGVNVAIASAGGSSDSSSQSGSIGVGFAIPANLAQRVANEIIKTGAGSHGLLGATVTDVTATDAGTIVGAKIADVTGGGAADKAGLKSGDVVTSFNGVTITSSTDLTAQVRFLAGNSKTQLTYVRGGKSTTVDVTLGELTTAK